MRPDEPSDPHCRRLALVEGEASFTDEGAGEAVVCVHGFPGSARDFRWLAPALTQRGFRVLRVELPGFGGCSARVSPQLDAYADYLAELLVAVRVTAPVVLGHSFGGAVALRLAARYPAAVGRLALVASPGLRRHRMFARSGWGMELTRWARVPLFGRGARAILEASMRRAGFRHDVDARTVLGTFEFLRSFDFGLQADSWARRRAPTAVFWSADDPLIEDAISADLARRAAPGPALRFSSGGHNPQKHQAIEIADALATWTSA